MSVRHSDSSAVESDDDLAVVLLDETASETSDGEVAIINDPCDLRSLDETSKDSCERRLKKIYEVFRHMGKDYVLRTDNMGFDEIDLQFVDNIHTGCLTFDDERVSGAVLKLFIANDDLVTAAKSMRLSEFDFITLILDHVWKERDRTIEGFSFAPVVFNKYVRIEKQQLLSVAGLINRREEIPLSKLVEVTLYMPLELMVISTVLLADMRKWPIAEDLRKRWKENQEMKIPVDFNLTKHAELVEEGKKTVELFRNSRKVDPIYGLNVDDFRPGDTQFSAARSIMNTIKEKVGQLPSAKALPRPKIMPNALSPHLSRSISEQNVAAASGQKRRLVSYAEALKNAQAILNEPTEEISVLDVKEKTAPKNVVYVTAASLRLENIESGAMVMARQHNGRNFIKAQVCRKEDDSHYRIQFNNGVVEEKVDFSRVAVEIPGELRSWEGIRCCALFTQRLPNEKPTAFYAGTVAARVYRSREGREESADSPDDGGLSDDTKEMLVFFDNGCDGIVKQFNIFVLAQQMYRDAMKQEFDSRSNWQLAPKSRQVFIKHFLRYYPDWQLVRMKRKENTQRINVLKDGKACSAYVLTADAHFALLRFPPSHRVPGADCVIINCHRHSHCDEYVYRGSDRLDAIRQNIERFEKIERQARSGIAPAAPGSSRREMLRLQQNLEYAVPVPRHKELEETTSKLKSSSSEADITQYGQRGRLLFADNEDPMVCSRRQVARKTGGPRTFEPSVIPRSSVSAMDTKIIPLRKGKVELLTAPDWSRSWKIPHEKCTEKCLLGRNEDPYGGANFEANRERSPYFIPLLQGWTRALSQFTKRGTVRGSRSRIVAAVVYYSPCGVPLYTMKDVASYLKDTCCVLTIDLFTFDKGIRPNVVYRSPENCKIMDDFTQNYEALPIAVVNEIDDAEPPKMQYYPRRFEFNSETDLSTVGPKFCSGCSCTDDCSDEAACECRRLTDLENGRLARSLQTNPAVRGYKYRKINLCKDDYGMLSGIYECNDNCRCSRSRCFNRVVQQKIKIPMELFKTASKGWGVRSLVDVPAGVFVCVYAGALLSDEQAEKQGKLNGDEYFADLNLVDQVEAEKRNAGIDNEDGDYFSDEERRSTPSGASSPRNNVTKDDDTDYESGMESSDSSYSEPQRKRRKNGYNDGTANADGNPRTSASNSREAALSFAMDSLVMIDEDDGSNDSTTSQGTHSDEKENEHMTKAEPPPGRFDMMKYVEKICGKTPLYTVDAKFKGNIGRFFNHSCSPNLQTYHVYVDTHDFRLPWVAFFTSQKVSAGEELCWDYGYEKGAVAGKHMECCCGSKQCRRWLL